MCMVHHEPSWIVAVCANLATLHDLPSFSGVGVHYLKFTSTIPFRDMTSGVIVKTVGNDLLWVATTRQAGTIHCDSPFATCYGSGVLDMSALR